MTFYQILTLLGIPSLVGAFVIYVFNKLKRERQELLALKAGIQALLRAQMISDYNYYANKGHVPIYARENFENCYTQYHSMGKNGVMTDVHERFIALPTEAEANKER